MLCLQEIKVSRRGLPGRGRRSPLGYRHQLVRGEKGYNGVAILARAPFRRRGATARLVRQGRRRHAFAGLLDGEIELHNFYVPSGGPKPDRRPTPKFDHKLLLPDRDGGLGARGRLAERAWCCSATSTWRRWRPTSGTTSACCATSATRRSKASTWRSCWRPAASSTPRLFVPPSRAALHLVGLPLSAVLRARLRLAPGPRRWVTPPLASGAASLVSPRSSAGSDHVPVLDTVRCRSILGEIG